MSEPITLGASFEANKSATRGEGALLTDRGKEDPKSESFVHSDPVSQQPDPKASRTEEWENKISAYVALPKTTFVMQICMTLENTILLASTISDISIYT